MSYRGEVVTVPMGIDGLNSDDPMTNLPNSALLLAENVQLRNALIEKAPGSKRFNSTTLGSEVIGFAEWIPSGTDKHFVVVLKDGTVYSIESNTLSTLVAASGTAPTNLDVDDEVIIVQAGNESAANDRKLFIFTGNDPVQVISGSTPYLRSDIALPAADWSGSNQPSFGFVHQNILFAFGNDNQPDTLYGSESDNHEEFTGAGLKLIQVSPGDGIGIRCAFVYKGRVFLIKQPGIHFLNDDLTIARKLNTNFGAASGGSAVNVLDDMLVASETGSIISAVAADTFGDVDAADILSQLRIENFIRNETSALGVPKRSGMFYVDKKQAYFTYQSPSENKNDRLLVIDASGGKPKTSFLTKDQPSVVGLKSDQYNIRRPVYGAEDGFVYTLDNVDREVNGAGYTGKFQTPHMDFSQGDPVRAELTKRYEFLDVTYIPTGEWDLDVEVFIDSVLSETIKITLDGRKNVLDEFILDKDTLDGEVPYSQRVPLHGMGRRISFRASNSGNLQNFKIVRFVIYFKYASQQATVR